MVQGPVHKHLCLEDIFTMYMQLNNTYWLLYSVLVVCVHAYYMEYMYHTASNLRTFTEPFVHGSLHTDSTSLPNPLDGQ